MMKNATKFNKIVRPGTIFPIFRFDQAGTSKLHRISNNIQ